MNRKESNGLYAYHLAEMEDIDINLSDLRQKLFHENRFPHELTPCEKKACLDLKENKMTEYKVRQIFFLNSVTKTMN